MSVPAEFGPLFLEWLKAATEDAWSRVEARTLEDYERARVWGAHWLPNTRWTGGLSDREIEEVEQRYDVHFPPDHRLFLQVLHATEPHLSGATFVDGMHVRSIKCPGFYDWRDDGEIRAAFARITDDLLFDVEHNVLWPESWGARPHDERARRDRLDELIAKAPRLLPIIGHRYVLADGPTLVLSVHQSDIIVYGRDLRAFLLHQLRGLLGLETDPSWMAAETASIPFWGELIV